MNILRRNRIFTSAWKYFVNHHNNLSSDVKPKTMLSDLSHLPNVEKYWDLFVVMEQAADTCKQNLLKELLTECKLNSLSLENYQKEVLLRLDIDTLRQQSFIPSVNTITEGFLSCLEPFPYNDKDSVLIRAQSINKLSIRVIRDVVEQQYLSWKLECSHKEMRELFWRFRASLYPYRSITNIRRNLSLLNSVPELQKKSVAEKIYLINQKPFDLESLKNFEGNVAGLSWHVFRYHCPKTLVHSHQHIVLAVSFLKDLGFSEKQIQNGLKYLYLKFKYLLRRVSNILKHPELSKYRNDDQFLRLLFLTQTLIRNLVDDQKMSYSDLLKIPDINKPKRALCMQYVTVTSILYLVSQFFKVDDQCATMVRRHPKYRYVSEIQIHDTLQFLKENDFTSEEVQDSICIIFYSRELIKQALEKIKMEKEALAKIGIVDGCVAEKTLLFEKGTKEKRKILQLSLYYLEKPHHFSGDGVWPTDLKNSLLSSREI